MVDVDEFVEMYRRLADEHGEEIKIIERLLRESATGAASAASMMSRIMAGVELGEDVVRMLRTAMVIVTCSFIADFIVLLKFGLPPLEALNLALAKRLDAADVATLSEYGRVVERLRREGLVE